MSLPAFAELLERLVFTPSRNAKLRLLRDYFATRRTRIAAGPGGADRRTGLRRRQAGADPRPGGGADRPGLFGLVLRLCRRPRRDGGADLAGARRRERAAAALWPRWWRRWRPRRNPSCRHLSAAGSTRSDAIGRLALLKLITGGLRVGVSARLAKIALAEMGGVEPDDVEEVWHGLAPPYLPLFAWLEGARRRPDPARGAGVPSAHAGASAGSRRPRRARPGGLASGMEMGRHPRAAGRDRGGRRLYSRGGDDISGAFPEILEAMDFHAVLDGELLVMRDGEVAPFADLQQRLNRKIASAEA